MTLMQDPGVRRTALEPMSDTTFTRFSTFIQRELGIKMPPVKKTMLQARLQKRIWKLGLDSFDAYQEYVFSPHGREIELPNMIDVVTTNKTEFFREPKHFEVLTQQVLPKLLEQQGAEKRIAVWCAGCSTGEEPYSLAMVMSQFAEQTGPFEFFILATDISSAVLEKARLGIYEGEAVEQIPEPFRKKYLLKSKNKEKKLIRVIPEIRARVRFRRLNLTQYDFELREMMHIVFCRNVIIYFNRETQEQVIGRLCQHLNPGGYLFTGHSETLNGMSLPVKTISHTVYQKETGLQTREQLPMVTLKPAELFVSNHPTIVRTVLGSCVAVTMFHRRLGVAAICHALLPGSEQANMQETPAPLEYKYVDTVVPIMLEKLKNYGVDPHELEVKVFGGSDMLSPNPGKSTLQPVGKLNIEAVLRAVKVHGLQVNVSDVGGALGRKLLFYTHTGEVLLKRIKTTAIPE